MTQTEALRLAFEALHYCEALNSSVEKQKMQAITAIKAALEAKDDPAAWMYPDDLKRFETSEAYAEAYSIEMVSPTQGETVPLYTTPPQRTWVGLTLEEIDGMVEITDLSGAYYYDDLLALARAIEAKLKEKNT